MGEVSPDEAARHAQNFVARLQQCRGNLTRARDHLEHYFEARFPHYPCPAVLSSKSSQQELQILLLGLFGALEARYQHVYNSLNGSRDDR